MSCVNWVCRKKLKWFWCQQADAINQNPITKSKSPKPNNMSSLLLCGAQNKQNLCDARTARDAAYANMLTTHSKYLARSTRGSKKALDLANQDLAKTKSHCLDVLKTGFYSLKYELPDEIVTHIIDWKTQLKAQRFKDRMIASFALFETQMKQEVSRFIADGIEEAIRCSYFTYEYDTYEYYLKEDLYRDPTIFLNSLKYWRCNPTDEEYEFGAYNGPKFLTLPNHKIHYLKIVKDIMQYYATDEHIANIANLRYSNEQFSYLYARMHFDECILDALRIYVTNAENKFKPNYVKLLKQAYFGHFGIESGINTGH